MTDGRSVHPLPHFTTKPDFWGAAAAAWRDASTAIVVGDGEIGVVDADGEHDTAACAGCTGVALAGDTVVTARSNYRAGDGFDLIEFDRALRATRVTAAARLNERWLGIRSDEDTGSPRVFAASADEVYLSYTSRLGGARHGPDVIARYSRTGRQLAYLMVDGNTRDEIVSPDGRFAAMIASGSGGACITVANLRVVDLRDMRQLDTYPDRPLPRMTATGDLAGSWFDTDDLRWAGASVVAAGQLHRPPPGQTCDPSPESWVRTYDTASQSFTDRPADGVRALRVVGPRCSDEIGYSGNGDGSVIAVQDGAQHQLAANASIVASTAGSLSC
ncbi:hypothetical protein [Nocardia terpenica]|uniref:hypothetical protein n=1 Tax=Nocardia terpenica TaxID=455432 RepID=UPI00142E46A1|nr:hypothetical protein [Nocardia terpenica]